MIVTATEFKTNVGKYLAMADEKDIIITKNGKYVAKLTNVQEDRMSAVKSLRGILKGIDITHEQIREERLSKYFNENTD